jgi:hypothetical protein
VGGEVHKKSLEMWPFVFVRTREAEPMSSWAAGVGRDEKMKGRAPFGGDWGVQSMEILAWRAWGVVH